MRDEVVQYHPIVDRWDGFVVTHQRPRCARHADHNLLEPAADVPGRRRRAALCAQDYLASLIDTLDGAQVALALKPGTTVDTIGVDVDTGYTAELAIDLTKLGYPPGLGDGTLFLGRRPARRRLVHAVHATATARAPGGSASTRAQCCPAWAYLDPDRVVTAWTIRTGGARPRFALLGNFPNPFRAHARRSATRCRAEPRSRSRCSTSQGRLRASRGAGRAAGRRRGSSRSTRAGLGAGRLPVPAAASTDPESGARERDADGQDDAGEVDRSRATAAGAGDRPRRRAIAATTEGVVTSWIAASGRARLAHGRRGRSPAARVRSAALGRHHRQDLGPRRRPRQAAAGRRRTSRCRWRALGAITDADGRYSILNIPAGTYEVQGQPDRLPRRSP